MVAHDFIVKNKKKLLKHNLIFDKNYCEIITLPVPSSFNIFPVKYLILPEDIHAYLSAIPATVDEPEPQLDPYRQSVYQWDPEEIANQWHPEDLPQHTGEGHFDPWAYTNLGQKPKLGGVRISHRHYIHVHTLILVVSVHTFSLYYPC